ncbi:MAG: septum formation protein Maf [Acidobacteria bacterium]|nr:septum formation protein Maf [Acidobacteriota bacterium]
MQKIYLASKSPRRKDLLEKIGLEHEQITIEVNEENSKDLPPNQLALENARKKAEALSEKLQTGIILAADTVVVLGDNTVLGKPVNKTDAARMLKLLQGNIHTVITGLALIDKEQGISLNAYDSTEVTFYPMTDEEIEWYVETGEPMDKAGAYGLQEKGMLFVQKVEGSATNVIGLPVQLLYQLFKKASIEILEYI